MPTHHHRMSHLRRRHEYGSIKGNQNVISKLIPRTISANASSLVTGTYRALSPYALSRRGNSIYVAIQRWHDATSTRQGRQRRAHSGHSEDMDQPPVQGPATR